MANRTRRFKDSIYELLAQIGKSLSSGPRLEILDILCQGPRTVEVLANQVGRSIANTSHHLQVLRRARLVEAEKEGVNVRYRLSDDDVCSFYVALRALAESHLLEIDEVRRQYLEARAAMEPVDRENLIERVKNGEVTILDVRPKEEYDAGHLPGAISVPLDDLERRLDELPADRDVVAYCRGRYCVMALDAVEVLQANGYRAERLDEGVAEWKTRGLPVDQS